MPEDNKDKKIELFQPESLYLRRKRPEGMKPYEVIEVSEELDLRATLRTLRDRRWTVGAIFLIVFALALIATFKQKPVYRATALLEIERENQNIVTAKDLFQLDTVTDSYLETQYKVLHSETLAEQVIAQLHLDRLEEFDRQSFFSKSGKKSQDSPAGQRFASPNASSSDSVAAKNALRHFLEVLTITPVRKSRLVQVSFESHDPALAASIVNTLAEDYIQQNLQLRWDATQKASGWMAEQLVVVKGRLEKSEDALGAYAQRHGLLFLESEKGQSENIVDQRLRQLQEELTRAQADRYAKESLHQLVLAGDYDSLPGVQDSKLIQDLTTKLAELEQAEASLSPTFTNDYPKVKQIQSEIAKIKKILDEQINSAAQRITDDYLAAKRREELVAKAFEVQRKQASDTAEKSIQYNILKREVESNKELYNGLLARLKEAGVSAGLKATNIRVVDAAKLPQKPSSPNVPLNLSLGLLAGALLGVGAAFLQDHLDNTLKSPEDVEHYLQLPLLGGIPSVASIDGRGAVHGIYERSKSLTRVGNGSSAKPSNGWFRIDQLPPQYSPIEEAFRGLRTSVLLSSAERPPRSLLITSAQPGEGKTTVSSNLALSLTQLGQRVLLIDADLRRPCIHRSFKVEGSAGIVNCLAGKQDWRAVVQHTDVSGLDLLCCGPVPPSPAELLASDRMSMVLREAEAVYDAVLVDSPPMLSFADGRIVASLVEGVVLVVKSGGTPRELSKRAAAYADSVGGNLIGVVLNSVNIHADDYGYGYGYGYGDYRPHGEDESEQAEKPKARRAGAGI